jgi:hypothetical protein
MRLPPLATVSTDPNSTLPNGVPGAVGGPSTAVIFGDRRVFDQGTSGIEIRGGYWLDDAQTTGIDLGAFIMAQARIGGTFGASASDTFAIYVPFFDITNGFPSRSFIGGAGIDGGIHVDATSQFWGTDINFRRNLYRDGCTNFDVLLGYRYLRLEDNLTMETTSDFFGLQQNLTFDRFRTHNDFNGGQIGIMGERRFGQFAVNGFLKLALGDVARTSDTFGFTVISTPGAASVITPGGVLTGAQTGTNSIARLTHHDFAAVPEIGFNLEYVVGDHMRVMGGYRFLYISDVSRAGDQVDVFQGPILVNGTTVIQHPLPLNRSSEYYVHGFNVGVEFRY